VGRVSESVIRVLAIRHSPRRSIADLFDSSAIAGRTTSIYCISSHEVRLRRRTRPLCDVNCTQQEILKVECEKPDDSTRQFFSPTTI